MTHLDGNKTQRLEFVNRNPGQECEGTTNQEVLKAIIARVKFLDSQVRWELNDQIIWHLRMAIVLHEARALIRKTEKGQLLPEQLPIAQDGHFILQKLTKLTGYQHEIKNCK